MTSSSLTDITSDAALAPHVDQRVTVIVPTRRRISLRQLFGVLGFLRVLASRDMKVKYKQSLLGPLWLAFQPLALLLAFIVAFRGLGNVHTGDVPYAVFALVGLSAWAYFQAAVTICVPSMVSNMQLVRWTPAPRIALFASGLISSLPSLGITAAAAIISAAITGHLSPRVLLLPFAAVWLVVLTAGPAAILAALTVRFRDVLSLLPFLLQLGSFVAPVGYALAGLSPTTRHIVELNPLTGLIEAMRWMVLSGYHPELGPILLALGITGVVTTLGWYVFGWSEVTMADVI
ncbi:MAG TPA: ABC transporter permease [Solirubrobacteraceae bacterium]|jgi:ABC-type polysaccharide/polyol phosphate export permease|nr:ABC transporter permease [Solirubrobacteraceae bacterium]